MDHPLISVIVLVYNPGEYFVPCLESIRVQTLPDWECILVDNGSTDGSEQICDDWVGQDSRFRTVHHENKGIIGGRGSGFSLSRGEYIAFVDSDDLIHPQMLEELLGACRRTGLPCASCQFTQFFGDAPQDPHLNSPAESRFDAPDHLNALLHHDRVRYSLCNKIYHRSLFREMPFDSDIIYNEDLFLNWHLLREASGLVYLDFVGYHYRQHGGSTSHRAPDDKLFRDQIQVAELVRDSCTGTALEDACWGFYYEKLLYLNSMILRRKNAADYTARHKDLVVQLRGQLSRALRCPGLSPVMKVTALLSCWGGPVYRLMCRLLLTDRR